MQVLTDQQIEDMADVAKAQVTGLPKIRNAADAGGVLGSISEQIIEDLKGVAKRCPGLDRILTTLAVGTPQAVILEQLERCATEVMPVFQGRVVEAANAN